MGEWSKLITVNFIGGFCGDFICSLVYKSYYGIDVPSNDRVNKIEFDNLLSVVQAGKFFRHFDTLIDAINDPVNARDAIDRLACNGRFYNDPHQRVIANLYRLCYDNDRDIFIENVVAECRSMIPSGISDFYILTHVASNDTIPEFLMKNLFPGSRNVSIVSSNRRLDRYFRLLAYHKFIGKYFTIKDLEYNLKALESEEPKLKRIYDARLLVDSGEEKIYIDRFLFEEGFDYVEEVEKLFSSIMNRSIVFDRDEVSKYRSANKAIFMIHLGLDEDCKYDSDESLSRLNSYMDAIQNKNRL